MDFIFDTLINLLAHRIGVYVLGLLSGGRFKGESVLPGAGQSPSAAWCCSLLSWLS